MASKGSENMAVEDEIVETWKREQIELKKKLVTEDHVDWGFSGDQPFENLKLIGGVDISFPKGDTEHACACLVVLNFPELEVVYEDLTMVHLTSPYVPEYLAFREVGFLVDSISRLHKHKPELLPQVILVDGNGMLHPRGFGIACHLGVLTDIPTVGVAKTLFHVDGIERNSQHADQIKHLLKASGDSFPLQGVSGTIWGKALRSTQESYNPIYISIGHKVGLDTAVSLSHTCCRYRIPEPIRQEVTLEELVPNPNIPPCHEGAVLSRTTTSRNSSLRSEPITFPNDSEPPRLSPGLSPPQRTKQDSRRVVYSLRNGSPSPWVDRYKLKQKSISASTFVELRNKNATAEEPPVRGFSR